MKLANIVIVGISTLGLTNTVLGDDFTNERFQCLVNDSKVNITVPMPNDWSKEQRELASKNLCNTLTQVIKNDGKIDVNESNEDEDQFDAEEKKEMAKNVPQSTITNAKKIQLTEDKSNTHQAVCDTDYNCEVLWEKYHQYGIAKIFVAEDARQRKDVNVLEIQCEQDNIIRYTATESELPTICSSTHTIIQRLEALAKEGKGGYTSDFQLNWRELEGLMAAGYIKEKKASNDSPTAIEFLNFAKAHPEVLISGTFRNKEGAESLTKLLKISCMEGTPCYEMNFGLTITEVTIRFGNEKEIPTWFMRFCTNSKSVEELNPGFWHCTW